MSLETICLDLHLLYMFVNEGRITGRKIGEDRDKYY